MMFGTQETRCDMRRQSGFTLIELLVVDDHYRSFGWHSCAFAGLGKEPKRTRRRRRQRCRTWLVWLGSYHERFGAYPGSRRGLQ